MYCEKKIEDLIIIHSKRNYNKAASINISY